MWIATKIVKEESIQRHNVAIKLWKSAMNEREKKPKNIFAMNADFLLIEERHMRVYVYNLYRYKLSSAM